MNAAATPASRAQVLNLYRRILRVHRQFPTPELRFLGDRYARDEFRRHAEVDNPTFIKGFVSQWTDYAAEMERQLTTKGTVEGRPLEPEVLDKMTDQQVGQLWELRGETRKPKTPV
ncbi:hypothetical protein H9P43_010129 [Blastocladiella emersonii ATCC 22665]|nr:hypothetical protein H9P43_010129 [Blastocladiella emersonii ATCC 22665]